MKRAIFPFITLLLIISSCVSPVLRPEYLKTGMRNVEPNVLASNPGYYKGKLLVLGGIIANTTVTDTGTTIEALFVRVDDNGYLENETGRGRYLAVWPRENGILDPLIYKKNMRITVAGTFTGVRRGKIGKANYLFPVIDAVQVFLWKTPRYYPYSYPYYYPYYYGPYWYPYWGYRYYWWY